MRRTLMLLGMLAIGCVGTAPDRATATEPTVSPRARTHLKEMEETLADRYGSQYGKNAFRLYSLWASGEGVKPLKAGQKPIRIELDILKRVEEPDRVVMVSVPEGSKLRSHDDHFKVAFRVNRKIYFYLWNMDASGKVYPIYPVAKDRGLDPRANPIEAGKRHHEPAYQVKGQGDWFFLDDTVGTEFFFFFASTERERELEALLNYFIKHEPKRPPGKQAPEPRPNTTGPQPGPSPVRFEEPLEKVVVMTRGLPAGATTRGPVRERLKETKPVYDQHGNLLWRVEEEYVMKLNEAVGAIYIRHVARDGGK